MKREQEESTNKELVTFILTVALLLGMVAYVNLTLNPETPRGLATLPYTQTIQQGSTVLVDVKADSVEDLMGVQLSMSYNKEVLMFERFVQQPFLGGDEQLVFNEVPTSPGSIDELVVLRSGEQGISGTGIVASIVLVAHNTGNPDVRQEKLLSANSMAHPLSKGTTFISVEVKPPTTTVEGDLTGDGTVTVADLDEWSRLRKNNIYREEADLVQDGKLNIYDLVLIAKKTT